MQNVRRLQLTLALIKPDVMVQPHVSEEIRNIILNNEFYFVRSKKAYLDRDKASEFYEEHRGRFFYNRLVSYMTSGPVGAHILARENAITFWRELMGPTKVFKTIYSEPGTIRGRFGLTDTRNCTHGSDSDETARREIQIFFPDFDIDLWYETDMEDFIKGNIIYNAEKIVHHPITELKT